MSQNFRELLPNVDLDQLKRQFQGARYGKLVQSHLRKIGPGLPDAIRGNIEALSADERGVAEHMIDLFNSYGHDKSFWRTDCGEVLEKVWCSYFVVMSARNLSGEDKGAFCVFQIITLNFAFQASQDRDLRIFMGIRKSLFNR